MEQNATIMKLHILRHAKAAHSIGELDIDRELAEKGIEQVSLLKEFLKNDLKGPAVWCSDSTRTRMTFEGIKDVINPSSITFKPEFYLCSKETILEQLWNYSLDTEILIIGHNFGISDLLNYFTEESVLLETCEYVCIDFGKLKLNESSRETGVLTTQFRPEV